MSEITKLINVAKAEVGYLEKKSNSSLDSKTANAGTGNYTKYARDLDNIKGFYNGKKNGYAWCDVFVDWCFVKTFGVERAKKLLNHDTLGAGCTYSAKYYQNKKQWYKTPKIGDQIFFTDNNGKTHFHTGLVYDVDSKYVYTIEGNTSSDEGVVANGGCVRAKKYLLTYKKIGGYGRPKYEVENMAPEVQLKYVYNCDSLNVRKGNGTKYGIVRTIKAGTLVTIYEIKGTWARIGENEWCSNKYLSDKKPVTYKTKTVFNCTTLNVRNKPSLLGKKIGTLKKGAKVKVYSTSGSWSKISQNENKYCSSKYLK